MVSIIVAFPKVENGKSIKNILVKHGFHVSAVCTTGAKALQHADLLGEGIVICAGRLADMMYAQLREYLPGSFEMLAVLSPDAWEEQGMGQVTCLAMPLKVHELAGAVERLADSMERRRKRKKPRQAKRSEADTQAIKKAKEILMARNGMAEEEAHRYLQKSSMDSGTGLAEAARIFLAMVEK